MRPRFISILTPNLTVFHQYLEGNRLVSMPIQPSSGAKDPGSVEIKRNTLLDLKPYVPKFDYRLDVRTGWLEWLFSNIIVCRELLCSS